MRTFILLLLVFFFSCHNKGQSLDEKYTCNSSRQVIHDTILYTSTLGTKQHAIDVVTMLYDTTVIPKDAMAIEDNIIVQKINFKLDGVVINTHVVSSERFSLYDIYVTEIKPEDHKRLMSINHLSSVRFLNIDGKLYYYFEGYENLIDKRAYYMFADSEGKIIYEEYINKKGSLDSFMQEKGIYEKWKNRELHVPDFTVYPYEFLCEKEESIMPYYIDISEYEYKYQSKCY